MRTITRGPNAIIDPGQSNTQKMKNSKRDGYFSCCQIKFSAGFSLNLPGDERHSTKEVSFRYHHVINYRLLAFKKQKDRCHCYGVSMWLGNSDEIAGNYGIRESQAKRFQFTAEHQIVRKDGGADEQQ